MIKVIIPVYKSEEYLQRCIESVLNQTEKNLFVVLVDDGSPDRCGEICDDYARHNNNIYVIHQDNKGISAARNAGIELKTNCEYIAFVDSDDWIHPRYFEALLKALETTGCSLSICGHIKTSKVIENNAENEIYTTVLSPEDCYCNTTISSTPAWGKLYHESLFQNIRFPEGKLYEEYRTTWKILFNLQQVAVVTNKLYFYFYNDNGISHSTWTPKRMEIFSALEEKISFFTSRKLEKALRRSIYKYIKTSEKYISAVIGTEYEKQYIPTLLKMRSKYKPE